MSERTTERVAVGWKRVRSVNVGGETYVNTNDLAAYLQAQADQVYKDALLKGQRKEGSYARVAYEWVVNFLRYGAVT